MGLKNIEPEEANGKIIDELFLLENYRVYHDNIPNLPLQQPRNFCGRIKGFYDNLLDEFFYVTGL